MEEKKRFENIHAASKMCADLKKKRMERGLYISQSFTNFPCFLICLGIIKNVISQDSKLSGKFSENVPKKERVI